MVFYLFIYLFIVFGTRKSMGLNDTKGIALMVFYPIPSPDRHPLLSYPDGGEDEPTGSNGSCSAILCIYIYIYINRNLYRFFYHSFKPFNKHVLLNHDWFTLIYDPKNSRKERKKYLNPFMTYVTCLKFDYVEKEHIQ